MAHIGQKGGLGLVGGFRGKLGVQEFGLNALARRDLLFELGGALRHQLFQIGAVAFDLLLDFPAPGDVLDEADIGAGLAVGVTEGDGGNIGPDDLPVHPPELDRGIGQHAPGVQKRPEGHVLGRVHVIAGNVGAGRQQASGIGMTGKANPPYKDWE